MTDVFWFKVPILLVHTAFHGRWKQIANIYPRACLKNVQLYFSVKQRSHEVPGTSGAHFLPSVSYDE